MNSKEYRPSRWVFNFALNGFGFYPAGDYVAGVALPGPEIFLNQEQIELLIRELDSNGFIKPRLDDRLRTEDLKITHRLLDIIEIISQDTSVAVHPQASNETLKKILNRS
jgi:hypothetical protein